MGYKKEYRAATIESINIENLHKRYQAFLNTLDGDDVIISVNYQVTAYRLESESYDAGLSHSLLVTYGTMTWVDTGDGEVKNE